MECAWPKGLEPGSGKNSVRALGASFGKMEELSFLSITLKKAHFKISQHIEFCNLFVLLLLHIWKELSAS